jgi:hypothetical protein
MTFQFISFALSSLLVPDGVYVFVRDDPLRAVDLPNGPFSSGARRWFDRSGL